MTMPRLLAYLRYARSEMSQYDLFTFYGCLRVSVKWNWGPCLFLSYHISLNSKWSNRSWWCFRDMSAPNLHLGTRWVSHEKGLVYLLHLFHHVVFIYFEVVTSTNKSRNSTMNVSQAGGISLVKYNDISAE